MEYPFKRSSSFCLKIHSEWLQLLQSSYCQVLFKQTFLSPFRDAADSERKRKRVPEDKSKTGEEEKRKDEGKGKDAEGKEPEAKKKNQSKDDTSSCSEDEEASVQSTQISSQLKHCDNVDEQSAFIDMFFGFFWC